MADLAESRSIVPSTSTSLALSSFLHLTATMVTRRVAAGKGQDEQGNDASTSHSQSGSGSSSSQLPYAVDATMSLSPEELGVLQEQYMAEQDKGYVSTQTKFNLAWWVAYCTLFKSTTGLIKCL